MEGLLSTWPTSGSPNQKTHDGESAWFLIWALLAFQNQFWKQFSNKLLHNN